MKTYKNNKGIVVYETGEGFSILIKNAGQDHYFVLFHRETDLRRRGFRQEKQPTKERAYQNNLFPNLHKYQEIYEDWSYQRNGKRNKIR